MIVQGDPAAGARAWAEAALASLERAAAGEDIVSGCADAIGQITTAARITPNLRDAAGDLGQAFLFLVGRIIPALREATEGAIPADRVSIGLTAAASLLVADPADGLHLDRGHLASALAGDLIALWHRRALAERGDRLGRVIALRRAQAAQPNPSTPWH